MFQGADVSGLDSMAAKAQQGADYAKNVATALKILVRALKAMSWTGWAATFAAYLEATVIPWVEATGRALENFANVLRAASALQKSVSEDSPQISVPASAYISPAMPAMTAVNPPSLAAPEYAIAPTGMTTVSTGGGAQIVTPGGVGAASSALGQVGASGGGAAAVAPGPITGGPSTGIGSLGPSHGSSASGPTITGVAGVPGAGGPPGAGATPAAGFASAGAFGSTGGVGPGGTFGSLAGTGGVGSASPGGSGGSGAIGESGSIGGSGALGGSGGPLGGAGPLGTGSLGTGSTSDAPLTTGDPRVASTAIPAGATSLGSAAAGRTPLLGGEPDASGAGSTVNPAMLAAPLGMAGLGAAALGGLHGKGAGLDGLEPGEVDDSDDEH